MRALVACVSLVLLGLACSQAAAEPALRVSTKNPKPGDPVLVTVDGVARRPKGKGGGVELQFFPVERGWQALFAVDLDHPPGELKVALQDGPTETLVVREHKFPEEAVTVPPEYAVPPEDKRKQIDADNVAVIRALKHEGPPLFQRPFRPAGKGKRTSPFGAARTWNGDPHVSRHLGLDLAARRGAPVRTVQRGKIALVLDDGFLMGGTVVVIHGAGIASAYFHLSDIAVKKGDEVELGAVLGKVGLSGRTTGPHIHMGIWVPGGFVDPAVFLRLKIGKPKG